MNDSELAGGYLLCREAYLRLRAIGDYRTGRMELLRLSMVTVIIGVFLIAATFASRFVTGDGALLFRAAGLFCVVSGAINFRWLLPASLLVEAVYVGIAGL
ncbi:MAG TPA: hypothetical protein VH120_18965, partial [Gemmataceae bacterium]|nr:hypothetical protein [Gemmataceae bacterium]